MLTSVDALAIEGQLLLLSCLTACLTRNSRGMARATGKSLDIAFVCRAPLPISVFFLLVAIFLFFAEDASC